MNLTKTDLSLHVVTVLKIKVPRVCYSYLWVYDHLLEFVHWRKKCQPVSHVPKSCSILCLDSRDYANSVASCSLNTKWQAGCLWLRDTKKTYGLVIIAEVFRSLHPNGECCQNLVSTQFIYRTCMQMTQQYIALMIQWLRSYSSSTRPLRS